MSNRASFEEITEPSTPVEKWFADYAVLLEAELAEDDTRLAETTDDNENGRLRIFLKRREIVKARIEHLGDLSLICDPRLSATQIADDLGDHIELLAKQLTSHTVRQDDAEHTMPAFEEDKLKAKIVDTFSLRKVVERQ